MRITGEDAGQPSLRACRAAPSPRLCEVRQPALRVPRALCQSVIWAAGKALYSGSPSKVRRGGAARARAGHSAPASLSFLVGNGAKMTQRLTCCLFLKIP